MSPIGNYNPHAPRILGQEWVPIRDEPLKYSPVVNAVELGTTYVQAATQRIRSARFYVNDPQATGQFFQVGMVGIYPAGEEDQSGPIRTEILPCMSGSTTGNAISFTGSSIADSLYIPGDGKTLSFTYDSGGGVQAASFWFNAGDYPVLNGKRILNVSLLYSGGVRDIDPDTQIGIPFIDPEPGSIPTTVVRQRDDVDVFGITFSGPAFFNNTGALADLTTVPLAASNNTLQNQTIGVLNLGDVNNYQNSTTTANRYPWRYDDLLKFMSTYGAGRQQIYVRVQLPETAGSILGTGYPNLYLDYMALRVVYCEERRVAFGGKLFNYAYGMNDIPLTNLSLGTDPVIPAGTYLPTLSWVSAGEVDYGQTSNGDFPTLNAARELYQIPSHVGTQVNVPFPVEDRIGDTFTSEETHILPQLSLHTSGGTMVEPHVYGRQVLGQVYGSNTVTQEIFDSPAGGATTWPWVRFWAKRYGDTTVPLTLTIGGQSVSVTPDEFDALDEILNGIKAVSLRFSTPPTMGAGTNPQGVWSAAGETAGNRWEVVGAMAPAISGAPTTYMLKVPSPNQLSPATWGQPASGATINMGWLPGYSPLVTATTDDETADASIIFAQDLPAVTGLQATLSSQAISGIGQKCDLDPAFIPTDLDFIRITWSPTSGAVPASGFGYYELQRMDELTDWQTIAKLTSPLASGFNDYEARIGIQTDYRIRALDVYLFYNSWSSTVSVTIPSPGVTGTSITSEDHVLVFTSNASQTGAYNLAYCMAWSSTPSEDFVFPEASFTQLQAMYNRDFFTAFRPLERGGEQFARQILVQAAAISPETLADFTSLRDMAWASVPYVCVRDEDGNRWLATIAVPSGRVLNNRKLYFADVAITEVTDTAAEIEV